MISEVEVGLTREALANMPAATSHGESPAPQHVYLPRSHLRAMHPDTLLVTGMRGAGKTFWWRALQEVSVRRLLVRQTDRFPLSENDEVRTGFGVVAALDHYPSKDVLQQLIAGGLEPRMVWRSVQAWQLARHSDPLHQLSTWSERASYVRTNPERIERIFHERDREFEDHGAYFVILFDALDRCADDWQGTYPAIRGLLQTALDMRSYRRLRVKVFLRSDQVDESKIADFPDASKVISSAVELNWPRRELYGLLWHNLANGRNGKQFRAFLGGRWSSADVGSQPVYSVPRMIVKENHQRDKFHSVAGPWMGRGPKRGFPYTWIPNHLGDTEGRVSPRSFLAALQKAAEVTADDHPEHRYALHYDSIKRGVQEASKIRVNELREDYPWVDQVLKPLVGMVVPCEFEEIADRWSSEGVMERLESDTENDVVKLPPRHIERGSDGVRSDLESLGVFLRLLDGRVNIPDVFRVGYGLGRSGGVRPIR